MHLLICKFLAVILLVSSLTVVVVTRRDSTVLLVDGFTPSIATRSESTSRRTIIRGPIRQHHNDTRTALTYAAITNELDHLQEESEEEATEATLRALTFCHLPKDQEPELLCDFLLEIGACAASVVDADRGTDREVPVFREPHADPWQDSIRWAAPVWNRCNVTAYFAASTDLAATVSLVRECLGDSVMPILATSHTTVEQVPNRDWVVHVQQGWKPIVVGNDTTSTSTKKFVLSFPWHTDQDVAEALSLHETATTDSTTNPTSPSQQEDNNWVQLHLQGGIAFGTGEHPTTQLCLEWLSNAVSQRLEMQQHDNTNNNTTVLDYGSGSGVLGLAACALDPARVSAVGVDLDVHACRISNANAQRQPCGPLPMRNYVPPLVPTDNDDENDDMDFESQSLLLKAHAHAEKQLADKKSTGIHDDDDDDLILPEHLVSTKYDIGVANILAGPLQTLAPTLAAMLKPGAPLGLSGILQPQGEAVVQAYQKAGFDDVRVAAQRDGWVLVTALRGGKSKIDLIQF